MFQRQGVLLIQKGGSKTIPKKDIPTRGASYCSKKGGSHLDTVRGEHLQDRGLRQTYQDYHMLSFVPSRGPFKPYQDYRMLIKC